VQFIFLAVIELLVLAAVFEFSLLGQFFNVTPIPLQNLKGIVLFVAVSAVIHFVFVYSFFPKKEKPK
jgi:hypothetical protein